MILTRRNFLKGLAGFIAAPAIIIGGIKRGVLMPVQELIVPDTTILHVSGQHLFPGDIVQIAGPSWWADELLIVERITKEGVFVKRGMGENPIPFPAEDPERLTRIGTFWTECDDGPHTRAAWQRERDERES